MFGMSGRESRFSSDMIEGVLMVVNPSRTFRLYIRKRFRLERPLRKLPCKSQLLIFCYSHIHRTPTVFNYTESTAMKHITLIASSRPRLPQLGLPPRCFLESPSLPCSRPSFRSWLQQRFSPSPLSLSSPSCPAWTL